MKKITILMPVYNAEKYLEEAILSILNQNYKDFIFLIINDGSTDNSEEIIKKYANNDTRIKYIKNEKNLGIVKTLNKGLELIDTEYILRMDSDDIALPNKILNQLNYMEKHPSINLLGTQSFNFTDNEQKYRRSFLPTNTKKINTYLLFTSAIIHPSVMIRTKYLKDNNLKYKEYYHGMEDYELWTRIASDTNIKNLSKALINYRLNVNGITQTESKNVIKRSNLAIDIYYNYMNNNQISIQKKELEDYRKLINLTINLCDNSSLINLKNTIVKIRKQLNPVFFNKSYFDFLVCKYFRINAQSTELTYFETINLFNQVFQGEIKFGLINKVILYFKLKRKVEAK